MTDPSVSAPHVERAAARRFAIPTVRPSLATSQIVGWSVLAVTNAILLAAGFPRHTRALVGLGHLYYDSAQLVAVGLVSSLAVAAWRRWGPSRRAWGILASWVGAVVVGALVLPEDVAVLSDKLAVWGPTVVYVGLLVGVVAAGVPLAALAGRWIAPTRYWPLAPIAGCAGGAINHFFSPNDYPGMHLFIAWAAATLVAFSIARPDDATQSLSRKALGIRALMGLVCAWAVVAPASNAVQLSLAQSASAVVAPWIARLHARYERNPSSSADTNPVWFQSRKSHPPIPPTDYGLLPPDGIVIVMVIDATRADLFTNPSTTKRLPVLKRFADQSIRFSMARTPAPSTNQAVTSLMSGLYYSELYWNNMPGRDPQAMYPHKDSNVRYPELLTRAGIGTVQIVGLPGLLESWGMARGFKEEQFVPMPGDFAGAERMIPKAIERLKRAGRERLYMHFQVADPHAPYTRGGTRGSDFDRYVAEERVVDTAFGKLLAALREFGLEDRAIVVVTADHGEAFGEHGHKYHATALYEEMIRIPLMIRIPHMPPRVIDEPVSLLDLGPTVLDLFGIATPGTFMGQSLVPLLAGKRDHLDRPLIADSSRLMRAIYARDGLKLIHDRRKNISELYDLKTDPSERKNLFAERPERARQLRAAMDAFFGAHELRRPGYETPYGR